MVLRVLKIVVREQKKKKKNKGFSLIDLYIYIFL